MSIYRKLFDDDCLEAVSEVFKRSWDNCQDFGYQGYFEEKYTSYFSEYMGGGFTDAVCSGSVAVYLAIQALELPKDSEVIISPVTDPGSVSAVILSGFRPVICDAKENSFNTDLEQILKVITAKTKAVVLTHLGGLPIEDIKEICDYLKLNGIKIVEDCSQAHGAEVNGEKIGTFGDIASFSTMYRKNHASGGCGGLVYTKDEDAYWKVRSLADRRKPFHQKDFDQKDPGSFLGPGLNYNLDELSCAIGLSTFMKLPDIINKRKKIVDYVNKNLSVSKCLSGLSYKKSIKPSYYYHTIYIKNGEFYNKNKITDYLLRKKVSINPDYRFVVSEWDWMKKYLTSSNTTLNAINFRKKSFNLLFHEKYTLYELDRIIEILLAVGEI